MTDYPVQCFDNNGEPYGRYKNPNPKRIKRKPYEPILKYNKILSDYKEFEKFAEVNIFPMPDGTIGKTYERDEVEVIKEMSSVSVNSKSTYWVSEGIYSVFETGKKRFRLVISKTETTTQSVEKEPETVETLISSRQFIEEVYGTSTFARSIECKDAESIMDMMDDFLDWGMQKKQEASR